MLQVRRVALVICLVALTTADSVCLMGQQRGTQVIGVPSDGKATVIERVTVGVPRPPNGGSWDSQLGALLGILLGGTQALKSIQPDVRVCLESEHVPTTCTAVCEDADWSNESNAYVCTQATSPRGLFLEPKLHVQVLEIDPGSSRIVDDFLIDDPTRCEPCTGPTGGGTSIRFQFAQVASYMGPFRGVSGTIPPPSTLPVATPSSGGGRLSPPSPLPTRVPTASEVSTALSDLRDADHCSSDDVYFPQGTVFIRSQLGQQLGQVEANRLYQMAAFATAVNDPAAKQLVLNSIRSKVGDDSYYGVMTLILVDVVQSRTLLAAFRELATSFAGKIVGKGLDRFLPSSQPPTSLAPDVERWILKKVSTEPLATRAMDLMFSDHSISAECALNQLAKEGFIETIGARPE